MILEIDYAATFTYASPVSLSVHEVRLFPRLDDGLRLRRQAFSCGPAGSIRFRRDAFDNVVAGCFFPGLVTELPLTLELEIERREWNPFDFLLESRALTLPIGYTPAEQELLGPFLRPADSQALPAPLAPETGRPTVETLVAMNRWIHSEIAYERRDEGPPLSVAETLERRRGCCRDVAMLLLESLRRGGVAARLAAGFVWEGDSAPGDRRAEAAMHAWVEAYLPGAGWTGFDPTNGVLTDHHFLPVAIGLTPTDIAPVNGTYFHSQPVMSRLATKITVSKR
jgi:transglutaminase-like putative cysteine protease